MNWKKGLPWLFFVLAGTLPLIVRDPFYAHILIMTFFFAGVAGAWNLLGGFAGQISLGHAAFFGIGAYTSTLLFVRLGISPWIGMLAGIALVAVVGFLISFPSFKLRGPFFTLATIAFAEITRVIAIYWQKLTEGSAGIGVPFRPSLENMIFRDKMVYAYIFFGYMLLVTGVSWLIKRSYFGYYLKAISLDEDSARALGVNTTRYKLYAALLSAVLTSIGGTLYAQYIMYLEPYAAFSVELSVHFAMMAIIGGMGTVAGPVIGSFLLTPLGEFLRTELGGSTQGVYMTVYGFVLLFVVLVIPHGIIGSLRNAMERRRRGRAPEKEPREEVRKIASM